MAEEHSRSGHAPPLANQGYLPEIFWRGSRFHHLHRWLCCFWIDEGKPYCPGLDEEESRARLTFGEDALVLLKNFGTQVTRNLLKHFFRD